MFLKEIVCDFVEWVDVAQNKL